jgi:HK97 family phage prohead protease
MEHHKQAESGQIERRYFTGDAEFKSAPDGAGVLRGYALRFGVSYDMGWFTEEVDRRALDNAEMSDVRVLFNHDPNQILGRTKSGTARIGVDEKGLWYEVDLPNSPNGENARVAISRGDVTQSSWGFTLSENGDKWEKRNGKNYRVLTNVKTVFDASPVVFPANPDTSVAKRSFDVLANAEQETEKAQADAIQLEIEAAILERDFELLK